MLEAWRQAITEGLAQRNRVAPGDPDVQLRAALLMTAYMSAIEEWIASGESDASTALSAVFGRLEGIAREWAVRKSKR
jgi:hypothetical protein